MDFPIQSINYLFLSIPNFCGSTLVHNILKQSKDVVCLPRLNGANTPEGQQYLEVEPCIAHRHILSAIFEPQFRDDSNYSSMETTKTVWDSVWNNVNPTAPVRLQKSPIDIYRIKEFDAAFKNLKWVTMVRNPYQHVNSIFKRRKPSIQQACEHAGRTLEIQRENFEFLGNKTVVFTYEEFCRNPQQSVDLICELVPAISKYKIDTKVEVKDVVSEIEVYEQEIPKQYIDEMTKYFYKYEEAFNYWGYELK
jgi:hypothetical protein